MILIYFKLIIVLMDVLFLLGVDVEITDSSIIYNLHANLYSRYLLRFIDRKILLIYEVYKYTRYMQSIII